MPPVSTTIPELESFDKATVFDQLARSPDPVVLRGIASDWPLVVKARESTEAARQYLLAHYHQAEVNAFVSESNIGGRIFYTENLEQYNFKPIKTQLDVVLRKLAEHEHDESPPTVYMGSMALDFCLPGLREQNSLDSGERMATVRIWIGNRTTVAAHYDVMENIACVCAGRRRFTVFPPEQLPNLYVGPIDYTPAGQSVSLVDLRDPNLEQFPRVAEALEHGQYAELEPGDGIYIPPMWWHHVEGLESFNILINHWFRDVPAYLGAPGDALLHGILSIRDLPQGERDAWRVFFEHYVFDAEEPAHIPEDKRGVLGELDETAARKLRALLRNKLNR